jgi:hypothetical protein
MWIHKDIGYNSKIYAFIVTQAVISVKEIYKKIMNVRKGVFKGLQTTGSRKFQ